MDFKYEEDLQGQKVTIGFAPILLSDNFNNVTGDIALVLPERTQNNRALYFYS